MANPNITKVYLLDVPLENDYKNTLYFTSKASQQSYFENNIIKSYTDFSYQRKDKIIRIPDIYDNICNCNYVMYQNTAYSNKWFYAFITKMEYINDDRTDVYIETDVIQTWLFDYEVKSSFVEREHVSDDTVGIHTVPENVELGEYISNGFERDNELDTLCYIIQVTEWTGGGDNKPLATNFGGVPCPGGAYVCDNMTQVATIIQAYQNGREDAVFNVYMVPKKIVNNTSGSMQYSGQSSPVTYNKSISKQTSLNGYVPTNNKLLTYPYNFLILDNNNGSSNILQYENFSGNDCTFEIAGVPTVGGSIKCVPTNYKGETRYQQEGLMCGKFPACGWVNDTYTNWLTQNAVNIGVGIVSSGLQIVGGVGLIATGAGAGAGASSLVSGSLGIAQSIGQVYQHSILPNSAAGNTNGGDINTCYDMNKFYFIKMSIKQEYARIIDGYFDMFGYKVNRVKVPNKNHRSRWWYTKTIDVNIDGDIDNNDMQKIKNAYNNGITFWRNASEIQNYSLSNDIV